jgi:hypothetical protein
LGFQIREAGRKSVDENIADVSQYALPVEAKPLLDVFGWKMLVCHHMVFFKLCKVYDMHKRTSNLHSLPVKVSQGFKHNCRCVCQETKKVEL